MEQNQNISKLPEVYPPQTSIASASLPHHYDTMATHYVHSLTSSHPYYYFTPRYPYASGYYYPHHHYAHNGPQFGFGHATNSALGVPNSCNTQQPYVSPKRYVENSESQRSDFHQVQVQKLDQSSEEVHADGEKAIDPRIISILEPFRQFYSEREETLKKLLPGLHAKLSEFFKKVNTLVLNTVKSNEEKPNGRTLKRSLSLGSSPLRNDWFKVKPIDSEDTVLVPLDGKNGDDQDNARQ